jgi:hypothetical protein
MRSTSTKVVPLTGSPPIPARRLPDPAPGQLTDDLVGQGAAA